MRVDPGILLPRTEDLTWDEYGMLFALTAAIKSKDPSTRVGCALLGPDHGLRSTGFNGPACGVRDTPDRFERPKKYLYAAHAEANAVYLAAKAGSCTCGCTAYVTMPPCATCAIALIQAGIARVVIPVVAPSADFASRWQDSIDAANSMFAEAGVVLDRIAVD